MPDIKNFIAIGKIVKTIGIKGNLKVVSLTDFPERFNSIKKIFLYDENKQKFLVNETDGSTEFKVTECKVYDKYVNIKFDNYDRIEESSALINLILMIAEDKRVKLEKGNYYYYEMVGMNVFNKGELIGQIESVVNYGNDDLFNVTNNGQQILIPFRKEFVKNIDIKDKRIDVELIDGFLE